MPDDTNKAASGGQTANDGAVTSRAGADSGTDKGSTSGAESGAGMAGFLADMGLTTGTQDGAPEAGSGAAGSAVAKSNGSKASTTDQSRDGERDKGKGEREEGDDDADAGDEDGEDEGEGDADADAGDEGESEEEDDASGPLEKGLKVLDKHPELKGLKKRFTQLLRDQPVLKRENARLTKALESQGELPPVRLEADEVTGPLAAVTTKAEVEEWVAQARAVRNFADDHPEGGTVMLPGGKSLKLEGEAKTKEAAKAARRILESASDRLKYLSEVEATRAEIRKAQPTLYQKGHADHETRQTLLERVPGLLRLTDHDEIVRAYVAGRKVLEDERTGKATWHRVPKGGKKDEGRGKDAESTTGEAGAGAGSATGGKLPAVKSGAVPNGKAVVTTGSQAPREAVMAKARSKEGVSVDEMMDAGAL